MRAPSSSPVANDGDSAVTASARSPRQRAATAATTDVTFWLSAARPESIVVPRGVEVATPRTEAAASAIAFTTGDQLDIVPCELAYLAGPAEWGSDDALALVRAALAK